MLALRAGSDRLPPGEVVLGAGVAHRPAGGQAAVHRGALGEGPDLPRPGHRLGRARQDRAAGHAAQRGSAADRAGYRLVAAQHRVQDVDHDEVGQPGHGHVDKLLSGGGHVQGAADPGAGLVEQRQPFPGQVLLGDVHGDDQHADHLAGLVLDRRHGGLPGPDRAAVRGLEAPPDARLPGLDDLPAAGQKGFGLGVGLQVGQPQAQAAGLVGQAEHLAHGRVEAEVAQVGVEQGHVDGALGHRPVEHLAQAPGWAGARFPAGHLTVAHNHPPARPRAQPPLDPPAGLALTATLSRQTATR